MMVRALTLAGMLTLHCITELIELLDRIQLLIQTQEIYLDISAIISQQINVMTLSDVSRDL